MVRATQKVLLTLLLTTLTAVSFGQMIGFKAYLEKHPDEPTVFCVPKNEINVQTIEKSGITVKYSSPNWIFINASPSWINAHKQSGELTDFYFEFAPPTTLADTARQHHFVDQVHQGLAPLTPYTGDGVLIGIVDQGLDLYHPDFLDAQGRTRVLRYWDHTMAGPNPPQPYNYGQLWDSTAINNLTCTSTENTTAHGTSVAGIAVGDGSANGSNKGMAPDANIVIVESNFNLANWTLSIADAIDYIFKLADTLGMPAVVNLSLGTYLGSHDGNDPAAEYIETLLDEQGGRIVVAATGNSGAQGTYHQHSDVSLDTNFVWFVNNPSGAFGTNKIFFDLWTDESEATFSFALGADKSGTPYNFRGRTAFHLATEDWGNVIYDTIWNGPNRIATFEAYRQVVNNSYNLQLLVSVDSTSYLYRFETTGSGSYDLWSGQWQQLNNMVTALPSVADMPAIVNYVLPDAEQTIVSSWNCSEKVVSVGNFKNRLGHMDNNNNYFQSLSASVGQLSPNSSKGPNRHNLTKPDVAAAGDVSLGAGPLWVLSNPAYNSVIDSGGWHVRNGGTSMASPVVAGIAALYLERCPKATYAQFLTDIHATAMTDGFTGVVPNNAYGYGKPNAHTLLQELSLASQPTVNYDLGWTIVSSPSEAYQWYVNGNEISGETNQSLTPQAPYGAYQVMIANADGCTAMSEAFFITAGLNDLEGNQILVYPNPSMDQFSINSDVDVDQVVLIDQHGKAIYLEEKMNQHYSMRDLASGIYLLRIHAEGKVFHAKIIKN